MMHRVDPIIERFMLHPRICDVLEVLIGPDVACLQSMLFFNPPGHGGQGWHQDSAYITAYPDTLIGSWLALDKASMENGCLIVAPGSCVEPVSVALSLSLSVVALSPLPQKSNAVYRRSTRSFCRTVGYVAISCTPRVLSVTFQ